MIRSYILSHRALDPDLVVVEGECEGADLLARAVCEEEGILFEPHPADWTVYPTTPLWKVRFRADGTPYNMLAGPERNQEMLDSGVDRTGAFHADIRKSSGTIDMVKRCEKAGVTVDVLPFDTRKMQTELKF